MSTRRSRFALLGGCAVVSIGLVLSFNTVAAAGSNEEVSTSSYSEIDEFMESVGPEFMDNQTALGELKTWIITHPEVSSGYIAQINFAENRSVRLLWHQDDPVPAEVLAQAERLGIEVSVEYRSMSLAQIDQAINRIWEQADKFSAQGFVINSITGVGIEDTGLEVGGNYVGALEGDSVSVQKARAEMAARIASVAEAPVVLVESTVTAAF
jgi:hypothetical protein